MRLGKIKIGIGCVEAEKYGGWIAVDDGRGEVDAEMEIGFARRNKVV